jgi:1,4-alpha-glucan branching enzyme
MKKLFISIILGTFLSGQVVYWEPEMPVPGGEIVIYYNVIEGTLPNNTSPVYIHLGYNGWIGVQDYAMTYAPDVGNGWWRLNYLIPQNAETIDFVFTDLDGNWDNNGGVGIDWHISLNYYWTPFSPNPNDTVAIHLNNIDQGGHIAWTVDAGNGHELPIEEYWPEGTFVEDNMVFTPLIVNNTNSYKVDLGPFINGSQIINSVKFKIRWDNGEWDCGSNGQVMYYDIYLDYTITDDDPYVFFIPPTPSEGEEVAGPITFSLVGSPEYVEFWINGELIETDYNSPYQSTWYPDENAFGETTAIIRAVGVDGRIAYLFRNFYLMYSIINEPVPDGIVDGVNVDGNTVTITLYAPYKDYVAIKGSWNSQFDAGELMKLSGDTLWWYQTDLSNGEYTYQYNIDGVRTIADPWSKDVTWIDPGGGWESGNPDYAKSTFEVGAIPFNWTDEYFQIPSKEETVIYELHVGDFLGIDGQIGTYQNIIDKLEEGYFNDLGINAIELMPINEFEGANSWGYNATFYMAPETTYGTPDELRLLIDTAHQHGIAVLNDVVFNHLWGSSPLFLLYQPVDNWEYEDHNYDQCPYFHNQESMWGYKLQHWHNVSGRNYRAWKHISDVLMTWVQDYHFDGFRFDHTQGIGWGGNTNGASFYAHILHNYNPDLILIAEEDNSYQINSTDMDAGWDYSYFHMMNANLMEATDGNHYWGNMYDVRDHIRASSQGYNDHYSPVVYTENHDEGRVIYHAMQFQGMSHDDAIKKSKLGAAIMMTGQGMPMLFHGQEFGQNRASWHDPGGVGESPLQWNNLNTDFGQDLFEYYQKLIQLRKHYDAVTSSNINIRSQSNGQKSIVYWRTDGYDEVIIAANFNNSTQWIDIEFPYSGTWFDYITGVPINLESNWYGNYELPASTVVIFVNQLFPVVHGCTNPEAINYNPDANENDGSCIFGDSQTIELETGWNIISFTQVLDDMDMMSIFQPLINNGTLIKIQDESGNSIEDIGYPIGWINSIGDMQTSEGYKIKLTSNATLILAGENQSPPFSIDLLTGWNIIGYPTDDSQDALSIFQQLIDNEILIKVQDESGNSIEDLGLPIGWVNQIGNFEAGEGYKVKVTENTVLTIINESSIRLLKNNISKKLRN